MTLVLIGKDLVLEGSTTKIEDKQVPGTNTWSVLRSYNVVTYGVSDTVSPSGGSSSRT